MKLLRIIIITPKGHGFAADIKQHQEAKKHTIELYESLPNGLNKGLSNAPEALLVHDDLVSDKKMLQKLSSIPARVPLIIISEYCREKTLSKYEDIPVLIFFTSPYGQGLSVKCSMRSRPTGRP